ncbi:MAG: V-type ATP synthase subunit E [Candidatus Fermentithermobacillus carboniphilus]|uniref:V-type proton ATPase subunit E n=1 Tax=Candidatus Fermentithermobacillus carboniphilus TaxID=3085328 RepID=A0AAT9LA15_9FIRM|nr:MAG: V-type ATP synthase subunit E [Candidatus Fermentithermobacillus carboniphilus]
MPLENIVSRIEEKARNLSDEILSSAKSRYDKKISDAREEASRLSDSIIEEARAEASKIRSIASSRAESERKQMILAAKQKLLRSVFDQALERLSTMPRDEYRSMLLDMIANFAEGTEEIVLGKDDEARLGNEFAAAANAVLTKLGKKGQLRVSFASTPFGGGLILKSGGVSLNLTFKALLDMMRDQLELEVAKLLFDTGREGG